MWPSGSHTAVRQSTCQKRHILALPHAVALCRADDQQMGLQSKAKQTPLWGLGFRSGVSCPVPRVPNQRGPAIAPEQLCAALPWQVTGGWPSACLSYPMDGRLDDTEGNFGESGWGRLWRGRDEDDRLCGWGFAKGSVGSGFPWRGVQQKLRDSCVTIAAPNLLRRAAQLAVDFFFSFSLL